MKPYDPEGKMGPAKNLPDAVSMVEPKPEAPIEIRSEHKNPPVQNIQQQAAPQEQQEAQAE
jgi:small subunit ribosomal protein S3e